jgi:hypothetical protein
MSVRRRHVWLIGVEPKARSGGPFPLGLGSYTVYGAWGSHLGYWRAAAGGEKACVMAGLLP